MSSAVNAEIGDRVHQQMWRARITQKQLSEALGIDQAAVSRRLRGRTEWKVSELLTVAGLLGIHPVELIPTQTGPDGPGGTNGAVDAPTVSTRCSSQAAA